VNLGRDVLFLIIRFSLSPLLNLQGRFFRILAVMPLPAFVMLEALPISAVTFAFYLLGEG